MTSSNAFIESKLLSSTVQMSASFFHIFSLITPYMAEKRGLIPLFLTRAALEVLSLGT